MILNRPPSNRLFGPVYVFQQLLSVDIFEISLFVPLFIINRNFKGTSCYSTSIVRAGAIRSAHPYIMMYVYIQDDMSVLGCMFISLLQ